MPYFRTMRYIISLFFFFHLTFNVTAQIANVEVKFGLPPSLAESSGLIFFDGRLITHNDSGNTNELYELDTITGTVNRIVSIDNATNVDWEDLAQDDDYIYVGDFGNNLGNRTDLRIYKIDKNDYLSNSNVTAEIINFDYSDQVDFTPNANNNEWDAEALISFDTNLIVITKNWVTGTTKAYPIPKDSTSYSATALPTSLNNAGLITGATFNESTGRMIASGYNSILQPFVWICEGFTDNDIFSGTNTQVWLSNLDFEQVEAITEIGNDRFFLSSESFNNQPISDNAKLISFSVVDPNASVSNLGSSDVKIYPTPVQDLLFVDTDAFVRTELYDLNGRMVLESEENSVDVSNLEEGVYVVKVFESNATFHLGRVVKR